MTTTPCPHCGQQHPQNARFCPVTGDAIIPPAAACSHCGNPVQPDWLRCPQCAAPLKEGVAPPAAPRRIWLLAGCVVILLLLIPAGGLLWLRTQREAVPVTETLAPPTDTPEPTLQPASTLQPTTPPPLPTSSPLPLVTSSPTTTPLPTSSPPPLVTSSPTSTSTSTPTPTSTQTPLPVLTNPVDGAALIFIPAGEFTMGSNANVDPYFWGAEGPRHTVYLDEYWIYQTEVTNAMYQQCVAEQKCPRPAKHISRTRDSYYDNPQFANYPVIYVSYVHAQAYCRWAGGALPTEAQWEKAARGDDLRLFPWGDNPPTSGQLNYLNRDTAEVGSFPRDVSPYGVLDMAGNVWEWVFDYFQAAYYAVSPENNPRGPGTGDRRVIRGGAFFSDVDAVRTVVRASLKPDETFDTLGFRCVVTELP